MYKEKTPQKALLLIVMLTSIIFFSCTPRKKLIYLQNEITATPTPAHVLSEYELRPGDMLFVRIQTMDEKTFRLFNAEWMSTTARGTDVALFIDGYFIDNEGYIDLPLLGKQQVAGVPVSKAEDILQKQIDTYLLEATIMVKLINYKVTVMGEVNRPGTYTIYDSHITLLEALSKAGDLTVFGNRQNITVLRKSKDNKVGRVDVTDINVVNSEFFYLHPHDVVYIEPLKAKSLGFREFPFSILFSSITTIVVLINFFSN